MIIHIDRNGVQGGGALHILDLCKINKFKHVIITKANSWLFNKAIENGIQVQEHASLISVFSFIYSIKKSGSKIICVHAHGRGASLITRFLFLVGIRTVYTPHGFIKKELHLFSLINFIFELVSINFHTKIISISKSEYKSIIKLANKDRVKFITNWSRIKRTNHVKEYGNKFVSLIRFHEQKNPIEICYIAERLNDYEFHIYGDGPLKESIIKYIHENELNNVFIYDSTSNVKEVLDKYNFYLSTSLHEGLPLALIEALSRALPIIATNVPGNIDVIQNNINGLLYELFDVEQAAMLIRSIDCNMYKALSRSALSSSMNYSIEIQLQKYTAFYREI